jgi:hypothetical protein
MRRVGPFVASRSTSAIRTRIARALAGESENEGLDTGLGESQLTVSGN